MTAATNATETATVDEVRAEMLPDASAAADDAEVADAMEQAGITKKAPAAKKAATKAEEPTISVWVGKKIAEMAKAQKRGTLGAKLRACTPSKAGDHTVKLNRAEADKLAELATKVEGESTGMMALSARTLRARIDFAWND
ncbi:hypothetical protein [Modestobacter sp. SSW1-42]|uniref:hypothetical protein n=1 Tax=Modestobacter sp. SSW1-42 TaxID=596372 RepID=UPI003988867B